MNFNQLANSEIDLITSEAELDTTKSKLDLLAQKQEEKLAALAPKTADLSAGLAGLTGEAFNNQLSAFAKMDQNNLTAEDLQYALGYSTANPIQKDEQGNRFKLLEDAQGNFIEDENGQNKREYLSDTYDKGRNLYVDNTVDNNMKLGLAAEDKGFMGRYTPDLKQYIPFMDGYGWAPGEKGVTPEDGALLDTTLDYKLATDLEKTVHSNTGQIKNRAIGQGPITEEAKDLFGSGKTEYTTQNAPMWNIDYKDDGTALKEGTPLPKPVYDKGSLEEFLHEQETPYKRSIFAEAADRTANITKLAMATPARFIWDTADAVVETAGKVVGDTARLFDKSSTLGDNWDLGTGEERRKATYEAFGYDSGVSDQNVKEIHDKLTTLAATDIAEDEVGIVDETLEAIAKKTENVPGLNIVTGAINVLNKIGSNMSMEDAKQIVGTALSNPETAVESAAELATVVLGNKGAGAATKLGKLQKAVKADKTLTAAQKADKLKRLSNAATISQKFTSIVGNNAGLIAQSAYMTNNSLDDFKKENGRDATYEEIIPTFLGNALLLKIDNGVELGILKNSKTVVKDVIKALPNLPKESRLQVIAKLAKHSVELGYAGAKEILIEIPQEAFESTGKYNLLGEDAITGEELQKAIQDIGVSGAVGGTLGFAGGVHMKIPSTAKEMYTDFKPSNKVDEKIAGIKEDLNKTPEEEEVPDVPVKETYTDEDLGHLERHMSTLMEQYNTLGAQRRAEEKEAKKRGEEVVSKPSKDEVLTRAGMAESAAKILQAYEAKEKLTPTEKKRQGTLNAMKNGAVADLVNFTRDTLDAQIAEGKPAEEAMIEGINLLRAKEEDGGFGLSEELVEAVAINAYGQPTQEEFKKGEAPIPGFVVEQAQNIPGLNESENNWETINVPGYTPSETEIPDGYVPPGAEGADLDTGFTFNPGLKIPKAEIPGAPSTEETVTEQVNKAKAKEETEAKKGPKYENVYTEEDLNIEDQSTETHSTISERSIDKIAKQFKIYNRQVKNSLDIALGLAKIRKMKVAAGKEANKVQYEMYYGNNGVVPLYIGYKTAVQKGEIDTAVEYAEKLQKRMYDQEVKLEEIEDTYTTVKKQLERAIDQMPKGTVEEQAKYLEKQFNELATVKVGDYGMSITPKTAAADLITDSKLREALKLDDTTPMNEIRSAVAESVGHIGQLLGREGLGRKAIKYETIDMVKVRKGLEADVAQIDKDLAAWEKVTNKLLAEQELDEITEERLEIVEEQLGKANKEVNRLNREKIKAEKEIESIKDYLKAGGKRKRKKALPFETTEDLKKKARKDAGKPVGSVKTKKELKELEEQGIDTTHIPIEKDYKITTPEEVVEKVAKIKELQADKVEAKKVVNKTNEAKKFNDKMYNELDEWMIGKKTVEALATTVNMLTDELNDLQQDKSRLTNEKARAKRAQAKLEVHRAEIETIQKDLEKSKEEVADQGKKGFAFLKLAKRIKQVIGAVEITVAQIKTLLTTRKLEEVTAELKLTNDKIAAKEAEIKAKMKELTAEVKTKNLPKSISTLPMRVASLLGNRNKTYKALKSQKSDAIEKTKKLTEQIRKLESELFGTAEARKLLENSAGSEAKVVKADGKSRKVDQPLDLVGRIELKPTLLGQVKVEGLTELIEDAESRKLFEDIINNVDKELAKLVVGPKDGIKDKYAIQDGPAVGLLYTKEGKVNKQLAAVIALVATEYAGTDSGSLLHNSPEDIARMVGKASEYDLTDGEKELLRTGKFRKLIASQLGSAIADAMGMKIAMKEVDGEMLAMLGDEHFDNIKQDLGQMALLYASSKGYVRDIRTNESKIPTTLWNEKMPEERLADGVDGIPMVYAPKMTDAEKEKHLEDMKVLRLNMKNIKDSLNLQLREKTYQSTPQGKDSYGVRGSQHGAPIKSQNVLRTLSNQEYKALMSPLAKLVEDYQGDKKDALMKKAGWVDLETMEGQLKDDVDSQEARNREIEETLEEISIMYSKMENKEISEGVFFEWFFSKNGRYMMDSTTVNPQVDKMFTRFLLVPKENVDVEWDLRDPKDLLFIQASVAQAFGMGIDKKSTKDVVEFGQVLMNAKIKDLEALVYEKEGKVTAKVNGKDVTIEVEVEHIGHALQAIEGLKRLQAAGDKPFKATFTAEFDAVTSGFILKLMQIPLLDGNIDSVKAWLRKGAVLVDGELKDGEGMNDLLADKSTDDSYQTLTRETDKLVKEATTNDSYTIKKPGKKPGTLVDDVEATRQWAAIKNLGVVPELVDKDNKVTGAGRNMFKPTFMTFGYAASINSIKRHLANNLAKSVMEGVLKGTVKQKDLAAFGITTEEKFAELKEQLLTQPLDGNKTYQAVSKVYGKVYGNAVEKVMNDIFGQMIESNRALTDGSKAMFRLFKVRYDKAIEAWKEANPGKPITKQLIEQTTRDLEKAFPLIKAPWSQSRNEGVAIVDSKLADRKNRQLPAAQTQAKLDNGDLKQLTVQGMLREIDEAFAAGAVLPIHWLDGSIIGTVLADGGVLGVHDAIVLGLGGKGSFDKVKKMNEATYRESVEYNVMEEMLDAVLEAYSDVTPEELIAVNEISTEKTPENSEEGPLDVRELVERLEDIVKDSNKAREQIKGMTVGNIAGFAGMEFKAEEYEPAPVLTIEDVLTKKGTAQHAKGIMALLNKLMKDC